MVKFWTPFPFCLSLWYLLWWTLFVLNPADSSLSASDIVMSFENGGSTAQLMTPETWTISEDTLVYNPSAASNSLTCSTISNTDYTNTLPAKTFVYESNGFSFSLSISTGDSNYVLILGFCDDGTVQRKFTVELADAFTILNNFNPATTVGACKLYETYTLFTLSNSGTTIMINGSPATLSSANIITIAFTGTKPIINYTILVIGDCSKANYCSMCNDQLCASCDPYSRTCTSCVARANLNGSKCKCASQYYADAASCQLCDQLCETCAGGGVFSCSVCISSPSYLVDGVCLAGCPYGFLSPCISTSNPVIDINFNQDFSGNYGIFITGTSSVSYQFFNSAEQVDPVPSYKQGFYFSGTYLESSSPIFLSHTFSIALWAYLISGTGDLMSKGDTEVYVLNIQGTGVLSLQLQSPSLESITVSSSSFDINKGIWILLSYTVAFSNYATTITSYQNNVSNTPMTESGYIFRESSSSYLYLGKGASNFNGFIYNFKLWNTNYISFSNEFTETELCDQGGNSCFGTCNFGQYYSTSSMECQNCMGICSFGCTRASSCNICYDPLCSICTGFDSGKCTECVLNASKSKNNDCDCDEGYYSDGFSCVLCSQGCSTCIGEKYYQCSSCLLEKYFLSGMCLDYCPTGYSQDSSVCTLSTTTALTLSLQNLISLGTISSFQVGSSNSNSYPNVDSSDPIPSIYRGYYFRSTCYVTYSSFTMTPYFTITAWVKSTEKGNLLVKLDSSLTSMFSFSFTSVGAASLVLELSDTSTVSCAGSSNLFGSWHNIAFTGDISSGKTSINLYTDGQAVTSSVSTNAYPFIDSLLGTLYIGSQTGNDGFTGFLWSLKFFNGNSYMFSEWVTSECNSGCSSCPSELLCPDNCGFGYFYSGSGCTQCSSNCGSYGCRSTETCRLCKAKECLSCNSFDGACISCITNASKIGTECACNDNAFWESSSETCELCDANCSKCSGSYYFLCSTCASEMILVGNVCLNGCPQGFTASPICENVSSATAFQVSFDTYFMGVYGSIFRTSSSESTYQFFNSPDSLDPVPAYKRGLYFSGGQYLVSDTSILLNNNVSMGLWIYVISAGDILEKSPGIRLKSSGALTVSLESPSLAPSTLSTADLNAFTGWNYLSFSISFTKGDTFITNYLNALPGDTASAFSNIYRDSSSELYIGKSSESSFSGFIYYFALWNSAISDFRSDLAIPCSASAYPYDSCLWTCDIHQYFSSECTNCDDGSDEGCTAGCVRGSTCNICNDLLCAVCSGFNEGACTSCTSHASGTPCSCDANYEVSVDGLSCISIICFSGCKSCSGTKNFQCLSCQKSYYFIGGFCLTNCPTGYNTNSATDTCDFVNSQILYLDLTDQLKLNSVSGFSVGNDNTNVYPLWDTNDPKPSKGRGYYFEGTSYMTTNSNIIIGPWFTITIWIKVIFDGYLLTKSGTDNFSIQITNGSPHVLIKLSDGDTLSVSTETIISEAWHYISIVGDVQIDGKYIAKIFLDTIQMSVAEGSQSSYFNDLASKIILGTYNNYASGFMGFLWNLKIYNDNAHALDDFSSTCTNLCSACPSDLTCLNDCHFNEFSDSCRNCKSSCSEGCVNDLTCRLCKNKECLSCDTFSGTCISCIDNAGFVGTDCQCNENALWESETESCELCNSACSSCSTLAFTGCISCEKSRKKFENLCIQYCPTGYTYISSRFILDEYLNGFVFDLKPNQIKDTVYDSKSNIAVETGENYDFYPFYMPSDPVAAEYRGYYFTGTSYMKFSGFLFAPKLSIFTWIRTLDGAGDLLAKEAANFTDFLRLGLNNYYPEFELRIIDGVTLKQKSYTQIGNQWTLLGIVSDINNIPSQQIGIYLNGALDSLSVQNTLWFEDLQDSYTITIGASYVDSKLSNFFVGFLWDLMIWNRIIEPSLFITETCQGCSLCPISNSGNCLINCEISEYWDGNSCQNCAEACTGTGCVRPDKNCNLCADIICNVCDDYNSTCITCRPNAHLSIDQCVCDDGFYWNEINEKCSPCHSSCKSCTNENFMSCLTCANDYYLINGLCLEFCPLGYSYGLNVCTLKYEHIFELDLNILNGLIYDKKSLIPILTGSTNNFYKNYDDDDPIPAPLRGFYFNGNSSILHLPEHLAYITPKLIMAPVFTYSIWFNPELPAMTIASLIDSSRTIEFEISLANSYPFFTINLQFVGIFSHICEKSAYLSEWNHLMISIYFDPSGHSFINCAVNTVSDSSLTDSGISYYKASQSGMKNVIGAKLQNSNLSDYYQGFIFSINIFNAIKDISQLALYQPFCSENCRSCLPTKICIPNCSVGKFWIGPNYNYCSDCHHNCTFSCKDSSSTCSLCHNNLCEACTDYKADSCLECKENADNAPFCKCSSHYGVSKDLLYCEECKPNEYSDEGICSYCPDRCISCENNNNCTSCINNAEIYNGLCRCEIGYNGTAECLLVPFNASLAVNKDNSLNLTFSDELAADLSANDLFIEIKNLDVSDFSFSLEKHDPHFYKILLLSSTSIKKGAWVFVTFINLTHCVSISNGLLQNSTLSGILYHYDPYSNLKETAEISTESSAIFEASVGAVLALSVINPSPGGFWNMINALQIIYYLGLSKIPMSDSFFEIITKMNAIKYAPNIFSEFISKDSGNIPFDQAVKFSYNSDIMFLNAGCDITIFLIIIVTWLSVLSLSLIPYPPLSKIVSAILSYYKYSVFLRFWVQAYLDIGNAALISLLYFSAGNAIQLTSTLLSLASITLAFISPIALIRLSSNNLSRIQQEDKEYCSKWNSLFYEFKNDKGLISTQYYFVFFMRRLIYMVNLVLLGQHSETQISINILLSFMTLVYLIKYQPYKEILLQIANLVSEVAILLLMAMISANLFDVPEIELTSFELVMAVLILVVIGIQILASLGIFVKVCYNIIRKGLQSQSSTDHKYAISTVQPEIVVEDLERTPATQETEVTMTAFDKQMFIIAEEDEIISRT